MSDYSGYRYAGDDNLVNGTVKLDPRVLPSSPAWKFMQMVWDHGPQGSWERLRGALSSAAQLAITSDFTWDAYTLAYLAQACARYNGCHGNAYWRADEQHYGLALSYRGGPNMSFVRAYEEWHGRKPFILKRRDPLRGAVTSERLCVGSAFEWDGERVRVTSLHAADNMDGGSVYVVRDPNPSRKQGIRITRPMLAAHNAQFKPAKSLDAVGAR